jgi:hypothetical protein
MKKKWGKKEKHRKNRKESTTITTVGRYVIVCMFTNHQQKRREKSPKTENWKVSEILFSYHVPIYFQMVKESSFFFN